jgi:hypothetical protein
MFVETREVEAVENVPESEDSEYKDEGPNCIAESY